jgi:LysM repeat protein
VSGTLSRQDDQIVLTSDDGSQKQYPLIDPPADIPLDTKIPDSQLAVSGVIIDGEFSWTYIQYFENNGGGGGGGGGGGLGFYKLNLSGTPVPFPSPTPVQETNNSIQPAGVYTIQAGDTLTMLAQKFGTTVDALMQLNSLTDSNIYIGQTLRVPVPAATEQTVEDLRGYLSVSIHNKINGTSSKEYSLDVPQENGSSLFTMEGSVLGELDAYNGLPILVSGTLNTSGRLVVESYKIPYPDLHFQILKGTEKADQISGQNVLAFAAEDGKSYVEFLATNSIPNDTSITGHPGDLIQVEVLIIPDETFGGLPVAHIYQAAISQENGPEMQVQANQIRVYNDSADAGQAGGSAPPNLIIDKVELAYFVSNPYYQVNDPNYSQRSTYIQPVWHFHGRYEDGSEFDVLIQALKQEFLLPELVPNAGMG